MLNRGIPSINEQDEFFKTPHILLRNLNQGDTGPSMKINVVVSAPEMAVSVHFMDLNSLFSSDLLSRLYFIANPPVSLY